MQTDKKIRGKKHNLFDYYYFIGLFLATTIIVPWWTTDGFNVGKFALLVIFSFNLFFNLKLKEFFLRIKQHNPKLMLLLLIFPINLIIVFILNESNKLQQFYGEFGRRTGLLTYLAFFMLFISILARNSLKFRKLNILTLGVIGVFSAIYSFLQPTGLFQISELNSRNLSPYSFFGNSNFHSAFLGLASLTSLTLIIRKKDPIRQISGIALLSFFLIAIAYSESQQGFIVSFSGFVTYVSIVFLKNHMEIKFILLIFIINVFLIIVFISGLFGKGFASRVIFQESVLARNFYWSAGWQMAKDNPFLGLGLDRYGDWYWSYRDLESIKILGPENFSTSAHNIYLDIASSGGLTLFLSYAFFILSILYLALKNLIIKPNLDQSHLVAFSCWIALNVYSLFSIGHIGVFLWSWIFAGLVINTEKNNMQVNLNHKSAHEHKWRSIIGGVLAFFLILPVLTESYNSKRAQSINTISSHVEYLNSDPIEPRNIALSIQKLSSTSVITTNYSRIYVNKFPNNYDLWYSLYIDANSTQEEKRISLENLIRLNPYNQILIDMG